ncbi:putative DNA binding domain protein [Vibrio phage LV6]|nr:putative DNA binding domain protein [Vibrio phage LV6]
MENDQNTRSKKWYDDNKDDHNKKRRSRYANDPDYADRMRKAARDSAAKRRKDSKGVLTREKDGVTYEVLRISKVTELCNISVDTLKRAQAKGLVPPCSFDGKHRAFTLSQAEALQQYYRDEITAEQLAEKWSL